MIWVASFLAGVGGLVVLLNLWCLLLELLRLLIIWQLAKREGVSFAEMLHAYQQELQAERLRREQ